MKKEEQKPNTHGFFKRTLPRFLVNKNLNCVGKSRNEWASLKHPAAGGENSTRRRLLFWERKTKRKKTQTEKDSKNSGETHVLPRICVRLRNGAAQNRGAWALFLMEEEAAPSARARQASDNHSGAAATTGPEERTWAGGSLGRRRRNRAGAL